MRIKEKLQHIIKNSLTKLEVDKKLNEIIIESSTEKNNGDYYTNIAITLAKDLHKKPEEIADIIKKQIKDETIEKIEVTYPGTINIFINKKYLLNGISEIIEKNINYGKSKIGETRKINIDFINNKIFNELTKEDLYNAIYIDNLSRILKYNGFDITKEFYMDDTSEELVKLANIAKERYDNICKINTNIGMKYDNNNQLRDTAYYIYSLYRDTKINEEIDYFRKEEISTLLEKRKKELDNYRINFDTYTNEQSLYDKGLIDNILDKLNRSGYTYFNNDELWLKTTDFNDIEDRILIKSDGTYTPVLPIVAYYIDKLNRKYDGIISIYTKEDSKYKKILKSVLKMLGQDINKIEIKVLPEINIKKDNNEVTDINTLKELNINMLRYILSSKTINETIEIDLNKAINDNENHIYYIENTNIKINNILRNYNKKITKVNKFSTIDNELAYIILNKLYEFEDIVIISGLKQMPHLICNYLYELSNLFNDYCTSETIITEDETYTNERLNLLLAVKIVINNAFNLIGIIPREEI